MKMGVLEYSHANPGIVCYLNLLINVGCVNLVLIHWNTRVSNKFPHPYNKIWANMSLSEKWVYRLLQQKSTSHDVCREIYQWATPWTHQFHHEINEHKWKRQFGACLKEMNDTYQHLLVYEAESCSTLNGIPWKRKMVHEDSHTYRNCKTRRLNTWQLDHNPLRLPQTELDHESWECDDALWNTIVTEHYLL